MYTSHIAVVEFIEALGTWVGSPSESICSFSQAIGPRASSENCYSLLRYQSYMYVLADIDKIQAILSFNFGV